MSDWSSKLVRCLWSVMRFTLCSWVGAAVLFVVSVVREVTTPFEMIVKNQLVALRFPVFYCFGFTLLGTGLLAAIGLRTMQSRRRRALTSIIVLSSAALLLMLFDYRRVYLPLEAIVLDPKHVISPEFFSLHQWSKWVNLVTALLSLATALIASWDVPEDEATSNSSTADA